MKTPFLHRFSSKKVQSMQKGQKKGPRHRGGSKALFLGSQTFHLESDQIEA